MSLQRFFFNSKYTEVPKPEAFNFKTKKWKRTVLLDGRGNQQFPKVTVQENYLK